ncbi:MAG: EamA family transporter [Actinomycetes bacterium]
MTVTSPPTGVAPPIPRPVAIWAALGIVYVVWGSTYLGIRVAVQAGLPPLVSAGARFLLAGLILAAVVAVRRGPSAFRSAPRQVGAAAVIGCLLLFGGNGGVMVAEQTVPSGLAALLIAAVPLWVVIWRTATGDRPRTMTLLGVALGLGGLAMLALSGGSTSGAETWGIVLVIAATMSWATGSFFSSRIGMPADPFVSTVWEMLAAGAAMIVAGTARGELAGFEAGDVPTKGWVALAYLVVFGSIVAFTSYVWLLHSAPISLVATYAYVNPVVAVFLGWIILSETVSLPIVLGGAIVVAAVGLVVSTERPRPATEPEPECA